MVDYEKIKSVAKLCHFAGAGLLFLTSIMRFITFNFKGIDFLLSLYYIFFGLIIIGTELRMDKVLTYFYFMNFSFGKAIFAGFIATMVFSSDWIQLATFAFFLVACCGFLVLGALFTKKEMEDAIPKTLDSQSESKPETSQKAEGKGTDKQDNLPAPIV